MPLRTRARALARCFSLLLPAGIVAASIVAGCSDGDSKADKGEGEACLSNRQFFESQVWGSFMGEKCAKCHTPDGEANAVSPTDMVLQTSAYPGFLDTNFAQLSIVARTDVDGQSILLQKPLGKLSHGGGPQLTEDSPEYKALVEMTRRLRDNADPCPDAANPALPDVQLLDAAATFRKAAIDLGGRLPTANEESSVVDEAALDAALTSLMKEETFYERVREIYNDLLLTDRFLEYSGAGIDVTDGDKDYPGLKPYKSGCDSAECKATRVKINTAIAREPMNLVAHVVRNERPFTEVLTANYALVNPYLATAYGVSPGFADPNNEGEFKEVQVALGTGVQIPHAGVLSTPAFLNRWTTSPTNRSRGRARRLFSFFLATDVLRIAERPVDATSITQIENPTMNSSACSVCHRVIDPVAGGFRGYDPYNYEDFDPNKTYDGNTNKWYQDMLPPGFSGKNMPSDAYSKGLPWVAEQIAKDPRFVISSVYTVYTGLTGHKPLLYPNDPAAADYAARVTAWTNQDAFFRAVGDAFVQSNYNLKTIFKEILKSPYYRGHSLLAEVPAEQLAALTDIGTGRFLTPEVINRKINAVTGIPWRKRWEWEKNHDWLSEDFKLLYGGIDSNNAPARLTEPNGIATSVAWRMANEVACHVTAFDFSKPKAERKLFPLVEAIEQPELAGHAIDGSIASIKANLVYLHKRFLGETLDVNSPEIERSYQLFLETWRELSAEGKTDLLWECQARIDPVTGVELPDEKKINKDKDFTIRAWTAVTTYLLLDWKFLYQ